MCITKTISSLILQDHNVSGVFWQQISFVIFQCTVRCDYAQLCSDFMFKLAYQ